MFSNVFNSRSVLVTGHTGFKGSWLCQWLVRLGAQVHGYAIDPQPHETLYGLLGLESQLTSDTRGDIRDLDALRSVLEKTRPDIILHLAAQPLVRLSFDIPVETFAVNVMGTVNLLEAIRSLDHACAAVLVTTDKCYENREWLHAYREEDAMGGYDPYSASKGCAELVTAAYRRSFFSNNQRQRVASARAGNVIGGGDWARDRIVPDIFRALGNKQAIPVRNKHATRPWQHVLDPLSGYLWLAANLFLEQPTAPATREQLCTAFNFGPSLSSNKTVAQVVQAILSHTGGQWEDQSNPNAPHEASKLNLAIDKAHHLLDWQPTWSFDKTIESTANWYVQTTGSSNGNLAREMTLSQIDAFVDSAHHSGVAWAQ
jgi:CDP-glucose 4,6-dehydratase